MTAPATAAMHQAAGLVRRGPARRAFVAVVSGKGGVGKTHLAVNLAVSAARRGGRVLLVDGDLSLANVDLLLGLAGRRHAGDVLAGTCRVQDALLPGPAGVRLLPAASARPDLAAPDPASLARLLSELEAVARDDDLVLLDAGAGIGPAVTGLAGACPRALLVLSPEPTSLADAYATAKVLWRRAPALRLRAVVNGARRESEAIEAHGHLDALARRFLGRGVPLAGLLPFDPRVSEAVRRQRALAELDPRGETVRTLDALAAELLRGAGGDGER